MSREFVWVDGEEGLARLAERLAGTAAVALDTESDSGFAYHERTCLLQFNAGDQIWLVDAAALPRGPEGLGPTRPHLQRESLAVYVHGGEFDVACLKRDYGLTLGGVWDTQQAALLLGWEKTGYGAVVERLLGVHLAKTYTHYDWGRRPLPVEVVRYAVDDVAFLPRVAAILRELVREADLEEEVEIACQAVMETRWKGGFEATDVWSVKGAAKLPPGSLGLLAALHAWRDGVARRQNRPPGRLVNDHLLVALARRPPGSREELRRLGLGGARQPMGQELLEVVRRARREPPAVPPRPAGRIPGPEERARERRLRDWRRAEANRRGVTPQAVLPAAALEHLARQGARELGAVPQLGAKREALYGAALRRLCS